MKQKLPSEGGWVKVPNAVVEHLWLLTRAETALVLMVLRRGKNPISDSNWHKWTGLSPRLKEYAAAGLSKKGGLRIEGKGEKARYSFDIAAWSDFVARSAPDSDKARTDGRAKTVVAPAGMRVHEDCKNGCALLCNEAAAPTKKVVEIKPAATSATKGGRRVVNGGVVRDPARYERSLEFVHSLGFVTAGDDFMKGLLEAVKVEVSDDELLSALGLAWESKKKVQHSEGMFLKTVPIVIGAVQKRMAAAAAQTSSRLTAAVMQYAQTLEAVMSERSPRPSFDLIVSELLGVAEQLSAGWQPANAQMPLLAIEARLSKLAAAYLREFDGARFKSECDSIRATNEAFRSPGSASEVERFAVAALLSLPLLSVV